MATDPELAADFLQLQEIFRNTGLDFLRTDLAIALTTTNIAATAAEGSEKRQRNTRNARRAYDTILRLRERLVTTSGETKELDDKLLDLEVALARLGEVF
jgi:hypothetical protein